MHSGGCEQYRNIQYAFLYLQHSRGFGCIATRQRPDRRHHHHDVGLVGGSVCSLSPANQMYPSSCEPACGYTSNLSPGKLLTPSNIIEISHSIICRFIGAVGPVRSCNKNNGPAATGAQNACFSQGGNLAFSCSAYQPIIINSTMSYGFAGHGNTATATCEPDFIPKTNRCFLTRTIPF